MSTEKNSFANFSKIIESLKSEKATLIKENKKIKKERDKAIKDLVKVLTSSSRDLGPCDFCKHNIKCLGKSCEKYIEGKGCIDEKGKEIPNFKWTCMDFHFGTCDKLINTPCNGCNYKNNFEYKGLQSD